MAVCTTFHGNISNSCGDISLKKNKKQKCQPHGGTSKSQGVILAHPLETMTVTTMTKFYVNPCKRCWDISVWTTVDRPDSRPTLSSIDPEWLKTEKSITRLIPYLRLLCTWQWRKKKTPVCHTGMHLSIFSQARCKRTLSCRRRPWQSIVKESPPVRTCHGVTVCKQHQVAHWETECLHTCSLVLKVLICWNLEGCVWKGEAPAWASQIMPWLNVSRTWMLLTGRGLLIESWKHL